MTQNRKMKRLTAVAAAAAGFAALAVAGTAGPALAAPATRTFTACNLFNDRTLAVDASIPQQGTFRSVSVGYGRCASLTVAASTTYGNVWGYTSNGTQFYVGTVGFSSTGWTGSAVGTQSAHSLSLAVPRS